MLRVLVVNDDGIEAPGLHAIVAALATLDGVAVYVAAPTSERSATGHGITIHAPLVAVPVRVPLSARRRSRRPTGRLRA